MLISGVVVNGRVEFTEASNLPDGTEVVVDVIRPRDEETREEFLQGLRESIANADAGIGLVDAREFLEQWGREIAAREVGHETSR
jgi:hypothetical protein